MFSAPIVGFLTSLPVQFPAPNPIRSSAPSVRLSGTGTAPAPSSDASVKITTWHAIIQAAALPPTNDGRKVKHTLLWRIASHMYWACRREVHKISPIRLMDAIEGLAFDIRYRTITRRIEPVENLQLGERASQAVWYQPSSVRLIRKMVSASGVDPSLYTFVDLGCGRGRALAIAAKLGFREVVGIELSANLAHDALVLARTLKNVSVVVGDAAEYRFPEGPLFVFLYNPFNEEILRKVVGNLPPCIVAYANSTHAQEFSSFSLIARGHHRDEWRIYRI